MPRNTNPRVGKGAATSSITDVVTATDLKNAYTRLRINRDTFTKLESVPIIDEISGQRVRSIGEEPPIFGTGVSGRAYQMRPRSALQMPFRTSTNSEFSISFWLKPAWLQPVIDLNTTETKYYRMPLINFSSITLNEITNFYDAQYGFNIFEESREDGFNYLHVMIAPAEGGGVPTIVKASTPYKANKFHHIYVAYNGGARALNIFIDNVESEKEFVQMDSIPRSFEFNNLLPKGIELNTDAPGFSGLVRPNFGTIEEFYYSSKYNGDSETVSRHINLGSELVAFNSLKHEDITNICFAFDDPTSLAMTSVYSNGTNVYAGRSDGRIYRGDRLLWQSRRDFSNSEEIDFVSPKLLSTEASVTVGDGVLRVDQSMVRL